MFNPQTADWTPLALHCCRTHYNREAAKKDEKELGVPMFLAYVFRDTFTKIEELRHGIARTNL